MEDLRKKRGKFAEKIAISFLMKKKFAIITTNYRYRNGEIDIIAYDRNEKELVFVEVRSKWYENFNRERSQTAVLPEDTVNREKLLKIEKTAWLFLEKETKKWQRYFHNLPIYSFPEWRIDLVSVAVETSSHKAQIRHLHYLYA
jgi:Holliday junction resolvase-like predicted endonuclease